MASEGGSGKTVRTVILVAAIVAMLVFVLLPMMPDGTDDGNGGTDPDAPTEEPLPEGFEYDEATRTLKADHVTDWFVYDFYHSAYDENREKYEGTKVHGSESLTLEPGKYSIDADGNRIVLLVRGTVDRSSSWVYDMDGVKHDMSLSFSLDIEDFISATDANREFNRDNRENRDPGYLFKDLPGLVSVGDTVREIESKLASEYARIGGSTSDRQGYADFLAAYVQLSVKYPVSVPDYSGQYDRLIWGHSEYWCVPLETLYHMMGDCEDTSALLCAIYDAAGYDWAMGGHAGHVFAGVHIDGFEFPGDDRVSELGAHASESSAKAIASYNMERYNGEGSYVAVEPIAYSDKVYYAVETIKDQIPVGYLGGGTQHFDKSTHWGWSGFYTEDTKVTVVSDEA